MGNRTKLNARLAWQYGKGLIYLIANISANKISLPQGQNYSLYYTLSIALALGRLILKGKKRNPIRKRNLI